MSLTSEQKAAAYAAGSVAVTAGAGTGKTHMLAERYLYYLREQGLSPLEIVAVTFTEKAATELRSRIRSLVSKELPQRSDILAELEAAQISTIHALASRVCREHFEIAGVVADFRIFDELEGTLWLSDCLEAALAQLPKQFFDIIPYSLMSASLTLLLADPLMAERALKQEVQDWLALAQQMRQQALTQLVTHSAWQEAWRVLNQYTGTKGDRREEARQQAIKAMTEVEQKTDTGREGLKLVLEEITTISLRGGSAKKWLNGGFEAVKEAITAVRELVKDALKQGLITLQMGEADEQLALKLPVLREAYRLVSNYLTHVKQKARILTFADLEVYALRAVTHPQVQAYYQQRWRVFLVDEFQDTNPTQGEFLEMLSQQAHLTIVGDVKQSIYGFRRADVGVFNQFRDRILNTNGTEVNLNLSFRTHQPLVTQVNQVFAPLLKDLHQELRAHRTQAPTSPPHIRVFRVENNSESNKLQRQRVEAYYIAHSLKQMLEQRISIHDKYTQQLRPLTPGDIAILTRTWEPLETYAEALAAQGIPVSPGGGGNLLATREAKDAWAMLRFLADPSDDIALVALLRSPFFAISDRILFQLGSETREINTEREPNLQPATCNLQPTWWSKITEAKFSELTHPINVLTQLLNQRHEIAPSRLLQLTDRLTGYTAIIANLPGAVRREADWQGFRELVRRLEQGTNDVFGVVRRLKHLIEREVPVPRPPIYAGNAVSLMTIFAAKGLEWPIVVVADLTRTQPQQSPPTYFDPEFGVALICQNNQGEKQKPVLYRYLEYLYKQREEAESLRVLYVALTRAQDYLLLSAANETGGDLERLRPGLEIASIPIEIIPFNAEKMLPPSPLPSSIPNQASRLRLIMK